MADQPIKKIKPESEMDSETFLKHMNARHKGAAGIQVFGKSNVPGDTDEHLLRKWHGVMHGPSTSAHNPDGHVHATRGDQ